ncbi:MAG: GGDEF domain-containing protein [Candidatus Absconditabacteria bacterium]
MRDPKRDWKFDVQLSKIQASLIGNITPEDLIGREMSDNCINAIVTLLQYVGFDAFNLYRLKGTLLHHRTILSDGTTSLKIVPNFSVNIKQYENLNVLLKEDGSLTENGFRISKIPVPGLGDDGVLHIFSLSDNDCFYLGIDDMTNPADVTPIESVLEIFAFGMKYAFTLLKLQHSEAEKHLDELTQVCNRKLFEKEKFDLVGKGYVVFLDIDNFKSINDTYGHQAGDDVLKAVASVIQYTIRDDIDKVYRYGGEEFIIFLNSPVCDVEKACIAAERIRKNIEKVAIELNVNNQTVSLQVTVSIGLTAIKTCNVDFHLHVADCAMYDAKKKGKNLTVVSVDECRFQVTYNDKVSLSPF